MKTRSDPNQISLFNIEDYSDSNVASGMSCGLTITSTRTKVSPHRPLITKGVLDEAATKLASLKPLNSPQHTHITD